MVRPERAGNVMGNPGHPKTVYEKDRPKPTLPLRQSAQIQKLLRLDPCVSIFHRDFRLSPFDFLLSNFAFLLSNLPSPVPSWLALDRKFPETLPASFVQVVPCSRGLPTSPDRDPLRHSHFILRTLLRPSPVSTSTARKFPSAFGFCQNRKPPA